MRLQTTKLESVWLSESDAKEGAEGPGAEAETKPLLVDEFTPLGCLPLADVHTIERMVKTEDSDRKDDLAATLEKISLGLSDQDRKVFAKLPTHTQLEVWRVNLNDSLSYTTLLPFETLPLLARPSEPMYPSLVCALDIPHPFRSSQGDLVHLLLQGDPRYHSFLQSPLPLPIALHILLRVRSMDQAALMKFADDGLPFMYGVLQSLQASETFQTCILTRGFIVACLNALSARLFGER